MKVETVKISLFVTCLCDSLYPQAAEAMVRLLARYGIALHFPEMQTCCGQPAFNSGYWQEAKASARTILEAFEESDYVLSPSGSCTGMIHHYYPELFADDPVLMEKALSLQKKIFEFSQFMIRVLGIQDVGATFPYKVTYHPSCHGSRLLGVKEEPLLLLEQVKGLELVPLPFGEDCCGFGGTFAVKMSDISGAMVSEKVDHILETEAQVLVGTDMGCLMNIAGHLHVRKEPIRVMHLAELLYEGVSGHAISRS